MPMTSMITAISVAAGIRPRCSSSSKVETALSARAMALVRAAKNTRTKNMMPTGVPKSRLAKTLGMVMNIREGPAPRVSGSPPEKANTAGMTISAAIKAMPVSKISTCSVAFSTETSSFI